MATLEDVDQKQMSIFAKPRSDVFGLISGATDSYGGHTISADMISRDYSRK